ncbi:MAG: radical SAM protein, partial [Firmicutes bacterium]|nr:radical SAM protein [Bacillota bacterium]
LMRPDIVNEAVKHPDIIFPVFTNGTLLHDEYLRTFATYRNLVPILSIEGSEKITDERRGQGMYHQLLAVMQELDSRGILYGVSITVTKENIIDVASDVFLAQLHQRGCKVVIYVEYVPVDDATEAVTPTDEDRHYLDTRINELRSHDAGMIFISFPGDEKASGGCLAAGRGFFHINMHGGAEPCPFSPYSDTSLKENSLKEALHSPLFLRLAEEGLLTQDHDGGCVLFEQEAIVKQLSSGRKI